MAEFNHTIHWSYNLIENVYLKKNILICLKIKFRQKKKDIITK